MTALLRACAKGHVGAIQTLIEHRADVYAVDRMRRSCLFYAAHENQHKVPNQKPLLIVLLYGKLTN